MQKGIHFTVLFCCITFFHSSGWARVFRVDMIPNGGLLGCIACHETAGGPRNAFGLAVDNALDPDGSVPFWSAALAALDSDGDGYTNGQELQDPDGLWKTGEAPPGYPAWVSNPGDALSVPPADAFPTPVPTPVIPTPTPTATPTSTPGAEASGPLTASLNLIAAGLTAPLEGVHAGDGSQRLFIVEQIGRIRIIQNGVLLPEPFLDIQDRLVRLNTGYDERGLLGLAFHPHYNENGLFYVYYSAPGGTGNHQSIIAEYRVSPEDPNRAGREERIIMTIPQPESNHNGGRLAFGPDGMLYIGLGDGGGGGDHHGTIGNGQDLNTLLGSILRIDVEGGLPYAIPPDNPFVGREGLDEIWAYGLRNPWKFAFDRGGDHRLYCADVGQDEYEEINLIVRGGNYGWRIMEGFHCYNPSRDCDTTGKILPIAEYNHTVGVSVTGGFVYRGRQSPSWYGKYIFGDYRAKLFYLEEIGPSAWQMAPFRLHNAPSFFYVLGFAEDEAGELYLLSSQSSGPSGESGAVYHMRSYPPEPVAVPDFLLHK